MSGLVFIVASISVCIGFGLAILIERRSRRGAGPTAGPAQADAAPDEADSELESGLVQELLTSLQELTREVTSNVDRHSSRVAKISRTYDLHAVTDPKTVLQAARLLVDANKELQDHLASAKEEIRVQKRQIQSYMNQARTDELTGLPNRRVFDQELRRRLAQWERQGIPLTLVMLDVDHFKRFNDFHGHQTGDLVLREVAAIFERSARDMDVVCRYGGEEFGVVLPGTTLAQATLSAERIRNAVATNAVVVDGSELRVTISAGLAQALAGEKTNDLVGRADKALYAAKNAGRNFTGIHDGETTRLVNPAPAKPAKARSAPCDAAAGTS